MAKVAVLLAVSIVGWLLAAGASVIVLGGFGRGLIAGPEANPPGELYSQGRALRSFAARWAAATPYAASCYFSHRSSDCRRGDRREIQIPTGIWAV